MSEHNEIVHIKTGDKIADNEEFGYVERDKTIMEKIYNLCDNMTSNPAIKNDDNVPPTIFNQQCSNSQQAGVSNSNNSISNTTICGAVGHGHDSPIADPPVKQLTDEHHHHHQQRKHLHINTRAQLGSITEDEIYLTDQRAKKNVVDSDNSDCCDRVTSKVDEDIRNSQTNNSVILSKEVCGENNKKVVKSNSENFDKFSTISSQTSWVTSADTLSLYSNSSASSSGGSSRRRASHLSIGSLSISPSENPAINDRRASILIKPPPEKSGILRRMSSLVVEPKDGVVSVDELPITFQVKYLGSQPARGLWGIKHTRRPVDVMVQTAKTLPPGKILPYVKVTISIHGITITDQPTSTNKTTQKLETVSYPIETISYGVQDLVYTRVFSMIIVNETGDFRGQTPFDCHAFVCESRNLARRLTYALAAAFQEYSKRVNDQKNTLGYESAQHKPKKFAIDLRSPEEIQEDIEAETEA